jgi:hypothetical protein
VCDGQDHDCDGQVDDESLAVRWYRDADHDGYGDPNDSTLSCAESAGYVANNSDCNDSDPNINPGALDCAGDPDGIDNDCSGLADDNLSCHLQPGVASDTDTDADGVPDSDDACPDTPAGAAVSANGCSCAQIDDDGDGVNDCDDICRGIPGSLPNGCPTWLCGTTGYGLIGLSGMGALLTRRRHFA